MSDNTPQNPGDEHQEQAKTPSVPGMLGVSKPEPPYFRTHFIFNVGPKGTYYSLSQTTCFQQGGRKFYDYCQSLTQYRVDRRIFLNSISEPVFAVFLRCLNGGSPPTTSSDWLNAANIDYYAARPGERKAVCMYGVELYIFAKKHDVQYLLGTLERFCLQALSATTHKAFPAVMFAAENLSHDDAVLKQVLVDYCAHWGTVHKEAKERMPKLFLLMCLKEFTYPEAITVVEVEGSEQGKISLGGLYWEWVNKKGLIALCDWFHNE